MSIIHEALKKSDPSLSQETRAARPQVELHRRRSPGRWGAFVVILICFLAAGPFLAPKIFNNPDSGRGVSSTAHSQFAIESAPLPEASAARVLAPRSPRQGAFALSGVVYSEGGSYCLINGLVLAQGDRIGDAVVETIAQDSVTLDVKGQKVTLTVDKP